MKNLWSDSNDNESGYASSSPQLGLSTPADLKACWDLSSEYGNGPVLPLTQKAVVTSEMGTQLNLSCTQIPVRDPKLGEAIVRIQYTGICRSDASFSIGPQPGYPKYGHIAGHEGIGRIVSSHDPSLLGRYAAIRYLGSSCGSCVYCLRSLQTSCPSQLNAPKHISGTFQQYATVPTNCLVVLPQDYSESFDAGTITQKTPLAACAALCSGSTALTALREAKIKAGDVVVVVGIAGAIGHLTGAIAKHVMGAKVIGVDLAWKIDLLADHAERYADRLVAASDGTEQSCHRLFTQLLEACKDLRPGRGPMRAAESVIISASKPEAFARLDQYVCDGGSIVCVGVPRGECPVSVPVSAIVERNLHISGNLMGSHEAALTVMGYIISEQIKPYLTEVVLEDVPEQMQNLVDCKTLGKVVVRLVQEDMERNLSVC